MPEYLDPVKVAIWRAVLMLLLFLFLLWGMPRYWRYWRLMDAGTTIEIERMHGK